MPVPTIDRPPVTNPGVKSAEKRLTSPARRARRRERAAARVHSNPAPPANDGCRDRALAGPQHRCDPGHREAGDDRSEDHTDEGRAHHLRQCISAAREAAWQGHGQNQRPRNGECYDEVRDDGMFDDGAPETTLARHGPRARMNDPVALPTRGRPAFTKLKAAPYSAASSMGILTMLRGRRSSTLRIDGGYVLWPY